MKKYHTIGRVQELILKYLFSHPDSFIQHIQKGIEKMARTKKDYKTVHTAIKNLEKKGLIYCEVKKKTKRRKIENTYRLTEKGFVWVLANGLADISRMSEVYTLGEDSFIKSIINVANTMDKLTRKGFSKQYLSKGFKLYLALLENGKMSREEMEDYLAGAMTAWIITRLKKEDFKIAEHPKPLISKKDFENLFRIIEETEKKLGFKKSG